MRLEYSKGNLLITELTDFDLKQTLECGQCFHFIAIGENDYVVSAKGLFLHVAQTDANSLVFFDTDENTFNSVWREYFDLDRNYREIKNNLKARDERLVPAMDTMWGVRILNQDFFETLISFIISQNNQISHIKNIVWEISKRYGKKIVRDENIEIALENAFADTRAAGVGYAFPDCDALLSAGEEGMKECKAGFRASYIMNACRMYKEGLLNEEALKNMSYDEAFKVLTSIKGVGAKVANCVLLFGLGKRNAFPVDVWIKRTMEAIYIGHEEDKTKIEKLAVELFGGYGGYAQQYLFYFGKELKLGK